MSSFGKQVLFLAMSSDFCLYLALALQFWNGVQHNNVVPGLKIMNQCLSLLEKTVCLLIQSLIVANTRLLCFERAQFVKLSVFEA